MNETVERAQKMQPSQGARMPDFSRIAPIKSQADLVQDVLRALDKQNKLLESIAKDIEAIAKNTRS